MLPIGVLEPYRVPNSDLFFVDTAVHPTLLPLISSLNKDYVYIESPHQYFICQQPFTSTVSDNTLRIPTLLNLLKLTPQQFVNFVSLIKTASPNKISFAANQDLAETIPYLTESTQGKNNFYFTPSACGSFWYKFSDFDLPTITVTDEFQLATLKYLQCIADGAEIPDEVFLALEL